MQTMEAGAAYERLNASLWRSRAHLERMEFLLEVQLMMLRDGRLEWQHQISELMETTAEAISVSDLEREVAVIDGIDAGIAHPDSASLRLIAEQAPDPWSLILGDHLVQLEATVRRIAELRQRARTAIDGGRKQLDLLVTGLDNLPPTGVDAYGQQGRTRGAQRSGGSSSRYFDGRA